MPQVKIHMAEGLAAEEKKMLVDDIRKVIPEVLKVPEYIGQVMLYETDKFSRSIHESRSKDFIFVEITLYAGRGRALKEELMRAIITILQHYTGVAGEDINCVMYELTRDNYCGGTSHGYTGKH